VAVELNWMYMVVREVSQSVVLSTVER